MALAGAPLLGLGLGSGTETPVPFTASRRPSRGAAPLCAAATAVNFYLEPERFPHVDVKVAGQLLPMSFDIAASVAYRPPYRSGLAEVQATSFDRIVVPKVRIGAAVLRDVSFTTRPRDDVFEGERVRAKLGASRLKL